MRAHFFGLLLLFPCSIAHAQWKILDSGTTANLRGIHAVGDGHVAWASGTDGTILRTIDSGEYWTKCAVPPNAEKLDFRGVQAFDEKTAYIMSSGKAHQSQIFKTTNGCQSWKLVFINPDQEGFFDAIAFYDSENGIILGDPVDGRFQLWWTDDKGKHWFRSKQKGLEADEKQYSAFAASNSSLLVFGTMVLFTSGGTGGAFTFAAAKSNICLDECPPIHLLNTITLWQKYPVFLRQGSESSGVFSLAAKDYRHLVSVGGDFRKPNISDMTAAYSFALGVAGYEWHLAGTMPAGYRSAVAYNESAETFITVGPNGTDISTDDGKNWRPLHPSKDDSPYADKHWNALSLPYVVGPNGRIGKLRENVLIKR